MLPIQGTILAEECRPRRVAMRPVAGWLELAARIHEGAPGGHRAHHLPASS